MPRLIACVAAKSLDPPTAPGTNAAPAATTEASARPVGLPLIRRLGSLPLIQAARATLSALRLNPVFTPRATFARWRTQRALRAAAKAARDRRLVQRDWQRHFRLNGLTWHQEYISQDLHLIKGRLRDLIARHQKQRRGSASAPTVQQLSMELVQLERSYSFLLDNVYDVYNCLEKHILFPWILGGLPTHSDGDSDGGVNDAAKANVQNINKAVLLFSKERDRIEDRNDIIRSKFARAVCATGFPYASMGTCDGARHFADQSRRLRRDRRAGDRHDARARQKALRDSDSESSDDDKETARRRRSSLFIRQGFLPAANNDDEASLRGLGKKKIQDTTTVAEAGVAVPQRAWRSVSDDDLAQLYQELSTVVEDSDRLHRTQRSLMFPIIAKNFSEQEQGRLTNIMVYSMRSALAKLLITIYFQSVEKQNSRTERRNYKREVPLPIRVYTPVWRARLYDGSPLGWLRSSQ